MRLLVRGFVNAAASFASPASKRWQRRSVMLDSFFSRPVESGSAPEPNLPLGPRGSTSSLRESIYGALSVFELVAIVVASSVLAAAALTTVLDLTLAPAYPDFIVGFIAWHAQSKAQDLVGAPIVVLTLFGSFVALSQMVYRTKTRFGQQCAEEFAAQLLWWSVPCAVAVAELLLGASTERQFVYLSGFAVLAVSATSGFSVWRGRQPRPLVVGLALLGVVLAAVTPFAIALALGRAPARLVGEISIDRCVAASRFVVGAGAVAVFYLAFFAPRHLDLWTPKFLLVGQIGLPLLFLSLYPARLMSPDGNITTYSTTVWLKVLLLCLIAWGLTDLVRRYRRHARAVERDYNALLSPMALFGVVVVLKLGNTHAPYISSDDYHFGEKLVGFWTYLQGSVPYISYLPPHGLIQDDLASSLSFVLYDGTAAAYSEAARLTFALLALVAYLSIYRFSNSPGLAFVAIVQLLSGLLFMGGRLEWLFLVPFACLWFDSALRDAPARWLSIWLLTVPILILGAPPQGLLLAAASGAIALQSASHLWVKAERRRLWGIGLSICLLLVAALLVPWLQMLFGALRYVFENGPLNQLAHGVPWKESWGSGERSGLLFEAIRMSWIAVPLASLVVIARNVREASSKATAIPPAVAILLFALLLVPYSMGRIDVGGVSRPGLAAIFGWTVLTPVLAWPHIRPSHRAFAVLLIALMSAALNFGVPSVSAVVSSTSASIPIGPLRDGRSIGLKNLGSAVVQEDHWNRLSGLNALLEQKLSSGETYLDLTSRSAHYFYLSRVPPVQVTAPYNMVPLAQQERAIASLSENPPRVALLEANNIVHDSGSLALRVPLLYRFVADKYVPMWENGMLVGYRSADISRKSPEEVLIPIKTLTDASWDRGVHRREVAVAISDSFPIAGLSVGVRVLLADGQQRRIRRISHEDHAIWLDGARFYAPSVGAPNSAVFTIEAEHLPHFRLALLDKAFSVRDLSKIPIAWGRSESSLIKRMKLVKSFDTTLASMYDLDRQAQILRISGNDPQIAFDVSGLDVSGHSAGLLRFEFSCLGRSAEPRLQVFWWGDDQPGPTEVASVRFTAEKGVLIVPLDAYPRWLALQKVVGIRFDLDNAAACDAISLQNISLYQRKSFLGVNSSAR